MGTEFSILTGKVELLLDGCSPGKEAQWIAFLINRVKFKLLLQSRGYISAILNPCMPKAYFCLVFLTLNSGGWADDKCLLEGFRLATQPSRTSWNRDTLLSESRNVDGGLLIQRWLVVEQRNCSPRRRHLLEKQIKMKARIALL